MRSYSDEIFGLMGGTVLCKSNEGEFCRISTKLYNISKKGNFRRYFDALIVPISFKFRANVRNFAWHLVPWTKKFRLKFRSGKRNFARNFFWESKISRNSSFGERNFVHQFVWGSKISCNFSFVRVDIKLNADEIKKSCAYNTF